MSRFASTWFLVVTMALPLLSVGCGSSSSSSTDAHSEVGKPATSDGSPDSKGPGVSDAVADRLADGSPADVVSPDAAGGSNTSDASLVDAPSVFDATTPDGTGSTDVLTTPLLDGSTGAADAQGIDAAGKDAVLVDVATSSEAGPGDVGSSWSKLGTVSMQQASVYMSVAGQSMTLLTASAVAAFGLVDGSSVCEKTTLGDCEFSVCPTTDAGQAGDYLSAGTVTITGLDSALPLASRTANAAYMSSVFSNYLWTTSRPVTVTVTGSPDVPAFTMDTVAPHPIVVTAPIPTPSSPLVDYSISRATDLAVTWTGGVEGKVIVTMGNVSGSLTCTVDATKGTLSVPSALMKKITGTPVNFDVIVHNTAFKAVGEWMMSFGGRTEYNPGTVTFTN